MRRVNESAQLIRVTVRVRGRVLRGGVVTPVAFTGEGGEGHHFNSGYPQLFEIKELFLRGAVGAFRGKRADVQFVKHQVLLRNAAPAFVAPFVNVRIDDFGRSMDAFRLKPRGRVGHLRAVF